MTGKNFVPGFRVDSQDQDDEEPQENGVAAPATTLAGPPRQTGGLRVGQRAEVDSDSESESDFDPEISEDEEEYESFTSE